MAAVLACGSGAVLSLRFEAVLWGLRRGDPVRTEVTVPRRLGRRKGIRSHRAILEPDEITEVDAIPITTAARTLLDLAAVSTDRRCSEPWSRQERSGLPTTHL